MTDNSSFWLKRLSNHQHKEAFLKELQEEVDSLQGVGPDFEERSLQADFLLNLKFLLENREPPPQRFFGALIPDMLKK